MKRFIAGLLSLAVFGWCTMSVVAQPPGQERGQQERGQRGGFEKGGQGGRGEQEKGPPGGQGGPGGPGGRGGRPGGGFELGRLIPPPMKPMLELSEDQEQQLAALEKEVKEKLNKLLTDDQKKQLENMRMRGPGGPGGGPGGGPDGGGPGSKDGRRPNNKGGDRPPPPDKNGE